MRCLRILRITAPPDLNLGCFPLKDTMRIIMKQPVGHIDSLHAVKPHLRKKVHRSKQVLFEPLSDRFLTALFPQLKRQNQSRCITPLHALIQNQITVTVRTLCGGGMLFQRHLAAAVGADRQFRRRAVGKLFTLFAFTEGTKHGVPLRTVDHVSPTVFTFKIHCGILSCISYFNIGRFRIGACRK